MKRSFQRTENFTIDGKMEILELKDFRQGFGSGMMR